LGGQEEHLTPNVLFQNNSRKTTEERNQLNQVHPEMAVKMLVVVRLFV